MKNIFYKFRVRTLFILIVLLGVGVSLYVFAAPPGSRYRIRETLAPSCAPGSSNCTVEVSSTGDGSINIKDFGAKGDGITNDAVAIQTALNSVSSQGGTVIVPQGIYNIGATSLAIKTGGTRLRGQTGDTSIIKYSGSGTAIKNDGTQNVLSGIEVSYIGIDTNGVDGATAIDFTYFRNSAFTRDVLILKGNNVRGFYGRGTASGLGASNNTFFQNDVAMNNNPNATTGGTMGSVGYYFDAYGSGGLSAKGPSGNVITGGRISSGTNHIKIVAGNDNSFIAVNSELARRIHIQVGSGIASVQGTAVGAEPGVLLVPGGLGVNQFVNGVVKIVSGKGAGQAAVIRSNTAQRVELAHYWRIIPDASSRFQLYAVDASNNVFRDGHVEGGYPSDFIRIEPNAFGTIVKMPAVGSLGGGKSVNADVWRENDILNIATYKEVKQFAFAMNNVAAGQNALPLAVAGAGAKGTEVTLPYDFDIVGISIVSSKGRGAGSLVVHPTVQGVVRPLSASLDGGNLRTEDVQMIPLVKELGGEMGRRLGVKITTDAAFKPNNANIVVKVFIVPK
ncbi:MAG: glycosyl hydrolase family 28-related protein [Candidatus Azambacteria bacterium]|nr:glycosyl hydrolase family 28-related protein [Candidatus Azambacteria bacterium]